MQELLETTMTWPVRPGPRASQIKYNDERRSVPMEVLGHVESLWRYPVKSMRGEELEEAFLASQASTVIASTDF